jgi:hypothetical protein
MKMHEEAIKQNYQVEKFLSEINSDDILGRMALRSENFSSGSHPYVITEPVTSLMHK